MADRGWAQDFVDVDGLTCPRHVVNDAVVAHAGAFAGGPGIMVVAGTGSIILGVTEEGEEVRNDRYHHYAGGARHLAFDAVARMLIDDDTDADVRFVDEVFRFWRVSGKQELRELIRTQESADHNDIKHAYGRMAPLVTGAAEHSPLADAVCRRLVRRTCVGVRLLAAHFRSDVVPVALTGGLALAPAFAARMRTELESSWRKKFEVSDAKLSPVTGAALLALQRARTPTGDSVVERLADFDRATA